MKRKKIAIMLIMLISMSMQSCITTRSTAKINKVEIGMTQDDIRQLLGKPLFKNANGEHEEWAYRKMVGEIAGPEEILFFVTFDSNGKVIAYNSEKEPVFYHRH